MHPLTVQIDKITKYGIEIPGFCFIKSSVIKLLSLYDS